MCPNGCISATQDAGSYNNGEFVKIEAPPLHGGEKNARRGATLGVYPPRTRRGYVPRRIGRGYPHALRRGLEKVNAAGRLKIWRAPRAGTRVLSGPVPLLSRRSFSEDGRRAFIEPPWRRQLFPAPGVSLGGVPACVATNATPPCAGWIHANACRPTTFVATNHCIPTTPCKKTIGTHGRNAQKEPISLAFCM